MMKVKIKKGAFIMQDFSCYEWPHHESYDVDQIFEVAEFAHLGKIGEDRTRLTGDGFGVAGKYGNGALYVKKEDLIIEEELADVEIMLEQMKVLAPLIEEIKKEKLKRLKALLENDGTEKEIDVSEFKKYTRKGFSEMRPYVPGEDLNDVSVADVDTPELGGMIARNPKNHEDQWYVAKQYFEDNLELANK